MISIFLVLARTTGTLDHHARMTINLLESFKVSGQLQKVYTCANTEYPLLGKNCGFEFAKGKFRKYAKTKQPVQRLYSLEKAID